MEIKHTHFFRSSHGYKAAPRFITAIYHHTADIEAAQICIGNRAGLLIMNKNIGRMPSLSPSMILSIRTRNSPH
jgi:hypothetical protein